MIFPSIAENHENMIFTLSVFTKLLFFCMKIRIFVWRKFVKGTEKIIFSLVFACSRFTEISYFPSFLWNENIRKQHLSANAYSCVNMKFSYTITVRKNEIFFIVLLRKRAILWRHLSEKMKFATSHCS